MTRGLFLGLMLIATTARALPQPTIDERLGTRLPHSTMFQDSNGASIRLGDLFQSDLPVVLVLSWYQCPMLCSLVLNGVIDTLHAGNLVPGRDLRLVAISFAPTDTVSYAKRKRDSVLDAFGAPIADADWPFLVGTQDAIDTVTAATGYGVIRDDATKQFAHDAAVIVLTPDGRISRYLYGIDYRPLDLRLALTEAAEGRSGSTVDRLLMTCYRFDPATRRYLPTIFAFLRLGAATVAVGLGLLIFRLRRVERVPP